MLHAVQKQDAILLVEEVAQHGDLVGQNSGHGRMIAVSRPYRRDRQGKMRAV
jgi:hypothetical protein